MVVVRRLQAIVEAEGVTGFADDIHGARKSLSSFKKTIGLAGGALAALGGVAIAGAVNEARKFQTAMVELEKVTNPETARQMSDAIMDMAETIPLAQNELAQIASDAGRFGIRGPKNIRNFTESVSKMATATDLSAQQAGESLAKLSTLTKTPVTEVENLGSAINSLSNNFATSSSEIVDSMLRSAGAMSQFGFTQTEIAGFSAALNAVSESSERAGTRLRRLIQEISNPKKVKNLAGSLGMTVKEFQAMKKNDPTGLLISMIKGMKNGGKTAKNLKEILSTTSRQALAGLGQNIDGVNRALKLSRKEFKKNNSLQKEFNKSVQTLDSRLKLLLNKFRNGALVLGQKLLPHVITLVDEIAKLVDWIGKVNKRFDGMLVPATLASSVIVGLSFAVGSLISALSVGAITAFAATLATIGIPLVALTAAITALGMAWKNNWFDIRGKTAKAIKILRKHFNNFMKLLNRLKKDAIVIFNAIKRVVLNTARDMRKFWNTRIIPLFNQSKRTFNNIKRVITNVLNFIQNKIIAPFLGWLTQQWNKHGKVMVKELRKTVDAWLFQINRAVNAIEKAVRPFLNWLSRTWNEFMRRLKKDLNTVLKGVRRDFQRFVDWFMGAARSTLEFIAGAWREHGDEIISIVSFFLDSIKGTIEFTINAIRTLWVVVMRGLRGDTKGVWREIKRFVTSTLNGLKGFLDHWGGKAIQWARGTFREVKRKVMGPVNSLKRSVERTINNMLNGIKREAQSWIDDFTRPFDKAKERVIGKFNDLKDTLIGNSIVPDMLSDIMSETGDWKGSFEGEFAAAALGAEDAMKKMPNEAELPMPSNGASTKRSTTVNNQTVHLDVTVPQGVDPDTAARSIADEVKSIGLDDQ